jgi:hypothetical protein
MSNAAVGGAGIVFVYLFFFIVIVMIALSAVASTAGNAIAGSKGSMIGLGVVFGVPLVAFGIYYAPKYWRMRNDQAEFNSPKAIAVRQAREAEYNAQQAKIAADKAANITAAHAAANTPEAIAARQAEFNAQRAAYKAANPPVSVTEKFEPW